MPDDKLTAALAEIRAAVSDPGKYTKRRELHQDWDGRPAMESLPEWQARAVQAALANTGRSIIRTDELERLREAAGLGQLPSAAAIRQWLAEHGWTTISAGIAGTMHAPPGSPPVGVPHGDDDSVAIAGAVKRIAAREGRPAAELTEEMRALFGGDNHA